MVFLGSLARTVVATKTVVPGDSFADVMMRIMISPAAHYLRKEHPSCFPAVVVDDVQCLVHGPDPVAVGKVAARLLDGAVKVMEDELHLPGEQAQAYVNFLVLHIREGSLFGVPSRGDFGLCCCS